MGKNLRIENVEKDQEGLRNITYFLLKYMYLLGSKIFYDHLIFDDKCNFFIRYFSFIYLILFNIFYFILNSDLDMK